MEKAVCVVSGGGDSITNAFMMRNAGYEVILVHVNHGQKCEAGEKWACERISEMFGLKLHIVDCTWLGKLGGSGLTDSDIPVPDGLEGVYGSTIGKIFTPGRNAVLLSVAGAIAESERAPYITLGCNQSEVAYPDNTLSFLDSFTAMLGYATHHVHPKAISPEWTMNKVDIYMWAFEYGYGRALSQYAWSCDDRPRIVDGIPTPCGKCGCCRNRRLVFHIMKEKGLKNVDQEQYVDEDWFQGVFLPTIELRGIPKSKWFSEYAELLHCRVI